MSQNSYNPYENPNPVSFQEHPSLDLEYATDPINGNEVQEGIVDMGVHYMIAQPRPSYSFVYDDRIECFPQPQTYPVASTAIQDQMAQASGRAGYQWNEDPNDAHAYGDTNELVPTPTTSGGQTGSRSMASINQTTKGKGRAQNSAASSTSGISLPLMTAKSKLVHRAQSQARRHEVKVGMQRVAGLLGIDPIKVNDLGHLLNIASDEIEESWQALDEQDLTLEEQRQALKECHARIAKLEAENAALKAAFEAQRGGVPQ